MDIFEDPSREQPAQPVVDVENSDIEYILRQLELDDILPDISLDRDLSGVCTEAAILTFMKI